MSDNARAELEVHAEAPWLSVFTAKLFVGLLHDLLREPFWIVCSSSQVNLSRSAALRAVRTATDGAQVPQTVLILCRGGRARKDRP